MYRTLPEKSGSVGESMVRKPLKRRILFSSSFPKRPPLGNVRFSSRSLTAVPLLQVLISLLSLTRLAL
jgi:hypothetical protein